VAGNRTVSRALRSERRALGVEGSGLAESGGEYSLCGCLGEVLVDSLALSLAWKSTGREADVKAVGRQCWRNDREVDMYL
jgi:hypothetical protein